jgi:hypothetical protein
LTQKPAEGVSLTPSAAPPAGGTSNTQTTTPAPPAPPRALPVSLGCVFVLAASAPAAGGKPVGIASESKACQEAREKNEPLVGHGDVVVVAMQQDFEQLTAAAAATGPIPRLFINGVMVDGTSAYLGTQNQEDGTVHVRFRVSNDKSTREFWMAQARTAGLTTPTPLRASIGWGATPATLPTPEAGAPSISVTSGWLLFFAIATIIGCLVVFVKLVKKTSYFRDGPPLQANGTTLMATYSLARIQSGLWLLFVVSAGIYITVVLDGQLPPIEPTLVGMLAVSAVTTTASIAVDSNAPGRAARASQGFLNDILTSWDNGDQQQLHRLQAVYVNVLLLGIGTWSVWANVAYPQFDASWLALLGVSGATQATLKQVLETPSTPGQAGGGGSRQAPAPPVAPTPPAGPPAPAPAPAPVPNLAGMPSLVLPAASPPMSTMPKLS